MSRQSETVTVNGEEREGGREREISCGPVIRLYIEH